ncbi:uncharacterized protein LOC115355426 [Myripristis murdjan]|uniref:uncharacterized protein LOC115355426 n=1 Tax=Myripristis murdjan TaxID=586833 RepID=UPI001175F8F3|nr:uncharacterized protein LOC115355426 [Myripristis murdjan]
MAPDVLWRNLTSRTALEVSALFLHQVNSVTDSAAANVSSGYDSGYESEDDSDDMVQALLSNDEHARQAVIDCLSTPVGNSCGPPAAEHIATDFRLNNDPGLDRGWPSDPSSSTSQSSSSCSLIPDHGSSSGASHTEASIPLTSPTDLGTSSGMQLDCTQSTGGWPAADSGTDPAAAPASTAAAFTVDDLQILFAVLSLSSEPTTASPCCQSALRTQTTPRKRKLDACTRLENEVVAPKRRTMSSGHVIPRLQYFH